MEEALIALIRRDYHKTRKYTRGKKRPEDFSAAFFEWFREQLAQQHAVLLLDALDEVPNNLYATLQASLGRFADRHSDGRLLLTSRIVGYRGAPADGLQELELVGFNNEQQKSFIRVWFTGTREGTNAQNASLEEQLTRNAPLRGLAEVPFMLGMICQVHSMRDVATSMRRVELYDECLTGLLGTWSKQKHWLQSQVELTSEEQAMLDAKMAFLATIALELFAQNKEMFTIGEARRLLEEQCSRLPAQDPLQVAWQAKSSANMLKELCEEDGILIKAGQGKNAPLMFLHLTFQEFLAATAIASTVDERGWDTAVEVLGKKMTMRQIVHSQAWNPRWQEVIVLLAGQLHDPEPLLTLLADAGHDDLFRHRLALAALCLPELAPTRRQELSVMVDRITSTAFSLWWEYRQRDAEAAMLHLTRVLPALGHANGRMPDNIPVLEWLRYRLDTPDPGIRQAAAGAVRGLGSAAATPDILTRLANLLYDKDPGIRQAAAEAAGELMEQGIRIFQGRRRQWRQVSCSR